MTWFHKFKNVYFPSQSLLNDSAVSAVNNLPWLIEFIKACFVKKGHLCYKWEIDWVILQRDCVICRFSLHSLPCWSTALFQLGAAICDQLANANLLSGLAAGIFLLWSSLIVGGSHNTTTWHTLSEGEVSKVMHIFHQSPKFFIYSQA